MKIGIVGYGFVGQGMYRLFTNHHDVMYWDKFRASNSTPEALVAESDIIFICVPTPMAPDGSADISAVIEAVDLVSKSEALIVIKSTVPPGTTDMLEESRNVTLHFSPEYMGEGKQFVAPWKYPDPRDARSHDFVICGGKRASEVLDVYATVMSNDARYIATSNKNAELAKYMENAFLATKVAFCYEFAEICATYDADYKEVRELWLTDPRMGRSHTMVLPDQKGFNGKCLPKDLNAIVEASTVNGYDPEMLRAIRDLNATRTHA